MDARGFRRAALVLSREHGVRLLRYLSSGEWHIASELSRALKVHTSTVSNLLAPMYELGFLQRRVRKTQNRSTFEYRMPSTRIALELDFQDPADPQDERAAYYGACIGNVFARLERLGWPGIVEKMEVFLGISREDLPTALSPHFLKHGEKGVRTAYTEIQQALLAIAADSIGSAAATRIFEDSAREAQNGRGTASGRHGLPSRPGGSS